RYVPSVAKLHQVNFGAPITRYSIDLSALTRCILAFASSPLTVCGGPPLTRCAAGGAFFNHGHGPSFGPVHDWPGAAAGAAGVTGAGDGDVRAPIVGATKAPVLNEKPPGTVARGAPATIGDTIFDSNAASFAACSAHTIAPHTAVATSSWALPCFGWLTVSLSVALMVRSRLVS